MIGLADAEREAERDGLADPPDDGFGKAIRIRKPSVVDLKILHFCRELARNFKSKTTLEL
jgi:hypothetical protein